MDDNGLIARVAELRQRIDRLTPTVPDRKLTRTEVATFAMVMHLQRIAIALTEVAPLLLTPDHAQAAAATLRSLSEDLIDSFGASGQR